MGLGIGWQDWANVGQRKGGKQAAFFNDASSVHFVCIFEVVRWGN